MCVYVVTGVCGNLGGPNSAVIRQVLSLGLGSARGYCTPVEGSPNFVLLAQNKFCKPKVAIVGVCGEIVSMPGEGSTKNILSAKAIETVFWCVCVVTGVCGNLGGPNPAVIG